MKYLAEYVILISYETGCTDPWEEDKRSWYVQQIRRKRKAADQSNGMQQFLDRRDKYGIK